MNNPNKERIAFDKHRFDQIAQKYRKQKGYTQTQLGELIGITRKSICCIERGETFPAPENIFY